MAKVHGREGEDDRQEVVAAGDPRHQARHVAGTGEEEPGEEAGSTPREVGDEETQQRGGRREKEEVRGVAEETVPRIDGAHHEEIEALTDRPVEALPRV